MYKIYKYTLKAKCEHTGWSYIGQTKNSLEERAGSNGKNYKDCKKFYNAILKYGWDNFNHEIIEENIETLKEANMKEIYWIAKFDSIKNGFNITKGGTLDNSWLFEHIYQLDVNKNIIKEFNSAMEANRQLFPEAPFWKAREITKCCKNKRISVDGIYFCFKKDYASYQIKQLRKRFNIILQMNNYKKILNRYYKLTNASKKTGVNIAHIQDCCLNKRKQAGGYYWCYEQDYNTYITRKSELWPKAKSILQLDKNTNQIINEFKSANEAAKITNISRGNISTCCRGEIPSAGGFIWKFKLS